MKPEYRRIACLLANLGLKKAVYLGPMRIMGDRRIIFHDVDFYPSALYEEPFVVREIARSKYRDLLNEITDLFVEANAPYGTEVIGKRIRAYSDNGSTSALQAERRGS